MKNYNLTLISGSDYTVANMSATGFNNLFFAAGGEAQFTPDNSSAGNITIWDSTEKDGKSISATTSVEAGKPYVGSWESSEQTTNTFTAFENAKAYGLTKLQLSQVLGGVKRNLTSADRNYPANNPDGIALWKLPSGMYYNPSNQKCYAGSSITGPGASSWANWTSKNWVLVLRYPSTTYDIVEIFRFGNTAGVQKFSGTMQHSTPNNFQVRVDGWALWRDPDSIVNSLNGSAQTLPQALDARQGKVLNESKLAVDNLLAGTGVTLTKAGEGASQTITVSAGGGIRTLTEEDYDFNSTSGGDPNGVALWKLPAGIYQLAPRTDDPNYYITVYGSTFVGHKYGKSSTTIGGTILIGKKLNSSGRAISYYLVPGGVTYYSSGSYTYDSQGTWAHLCAAYEDTGASISNSAAHSSLLDTHAITNDLNSTATPNNASVLGAKAGFQLRDTKLAIANLFGGDGIGVQTSGSGKDTQVTVALDTYTDQELEELWEYEEESGESS